MVASRLSLTMCLSVSHQVDQSLLEPLVPKLSTHSKKKKKSNFECICAETGSELPVCVETSECVSVWEALNKSQSEPWSCLPAASLTRTDNRLFVFDLPAPDNTQD